MADNHESLGDRLAHAYERMLDRVKRRMEEMEHDAGPRLGRAIDEAQEKASELGELTREEAERLGGYLRRDLEEAATFLAEGGRELRDWLRFDVEVLERGLADLFKGAVDQTRVDLARFSTEANAFGEWHSGEMVTMGSFQCRSCGEVITMERPGHIPPCPRCRGGSYRRVTG
jgi:hypothetical protein